MSKDSENAKKLMRMATELRDHARMLEEKARGDGLAKPTIELCEALMKIFAEELMAERIEQLERETLAEMQAEAEAVKAQAAAAQRAEASKKK